MKNNEVNEEIVNLVEYLDYALSKVNGSFYYYANFFDLKTPIVRFNIHNHFLENNLPFIFQKDRELYSAFMVKSRGGTILKQGFYLGSDFDNEGEEWKPEVKMASFERVSDLSKKVSEILTFGDSLQIIDTRQKIESLKKPLLAHMFENSKYKYSQLILKPVLEKELRDLPLELNLKIFYEFFEDLS